MASGIWASEMVESMTGSILPSLNQRAMVLMFRRCPSASRAAQAPQKTPTMARSLSSA
jgi:hypothetical protein